MVASASTPMRWSSALSTRPSLEAAIAEVATRAKQDLAGASLDLGILFISAAFTSEFPRVLPLLHDYLDLPALIGCAGGGIIGRATTGKTQEIESAPALALTLAHLPGVKVKTFHIEAAALPDLDSPPNTWVDLTGIDPADRPQFILLADPGSARVTDLLQGLDFAYPQSVKLGGLASGGGMMVEGSGLFCDRRLYSEGTVGVALSGAIQVDAIVAQGCRPIGHLYRVTEGRRNILLEVQGLDETGEQAVTAAQSPLAALQSVVQGLNEADRQLAQHSLFIGVARNEFQTTLEHGDFLIRNLLGVDPRVGAIAIGDRVRPGQRIQFHLRDAHTSAEDLEVLLQRYQRTQQSHSQPVGALMFACLGRGEGLYQQPNFDSQLFRRYLGDVPLSGFFCNGEIGPIGDSTFLHGYTSVFGIFREP
ncbi:FIST C-terminal domain-containing protein [Trichothermofontia sichuanensis B231]|uniref:FIST signal transduction protein n=1 Tax=Trichothermofontia sichuanensis TaxID=3045816 RepID=UPI0022457556|nr:FIST N-terminal domain-containing protein [Trichothermofontia sichuanensis]UZQ55291.1 FIST C-terminal domain-containing protein [Trichothermofontia sichuanensis B231]